MKQLRNVVFLILLAAVSSFAVIDTISVDVGISVENTMPIGLVPFEENGVFEENICIDYRE